MPAKKSSKALILEFFLSHIGTVLESKEIQNASGGASEWGRRVRELRDEQGYQILSHKDLATLKPGQYLLETSKRLSASVSLKKPALGFWNEMDTHAKCVELRLATLILLEAVEQFA